MNPEHLKTFLSVCRHKSFTRGAQERLLTQPAASRQVKQLEQRLGVRLFEQLGKSIQLTDAGRALAQQASELLGRMERVAENLRDFQGSDRGRLRIGASTTPGYYLLPSILGAFSRSNPNVELQYIVDNTLSIEQRIVRNELDIGFVGAHLVNAALRIDRLLDDQIVCFCGTSHPLCGRRRIAPDALLNELWVIREKGSATRQLFEQRLAALGGEIRRTMELSSPEGIKELVSAGIGVSFMSAYGLRREFGERRLHPLPITNLRLSRPIYAIRHVDKHDSAVMSAFLTVVHEGANTLARRGAGARRIVPQ